MVAHSMHKSNVVALPAIPLSHYMQRWAERLENIDKLGFCVMGAGKGVVLRVADGADRVGDQFSDY